jgi:hypothetical protein
MTVATQLWVNQESTYSNFAIIVLMVWALVVGVGAGLVLARRVSFAPRVGGNAVTVAPLFGLIPAVGLGLAIAAVQAVARLVL